MELVPANSSISQGGLAGSVGLATLVDSPGSGASAVQTLGDDNGDSEVVDYYSMNFDNFNISSEHWFNISCGIAERPYDFLKSVVEPTICCGGIVGILLTMVVLSRKTMCTSTNCYLTALAVADLLFLLLLSARIIVERVAGCEFRLSSEKTIWDVYSIVLMNTFQCLTVGVTVMLAVERYIAICHPMRAMTLCTVKRARIIIGIITVVAFILRSPKFLDIEIGYTKLVSGEEILTVRWVYLYNEALYTYIVKGALLTVLPLLALMVLNIRLIVEIRRSSRYLKYHLGTDWRVRSVVSSEELKITMMLVSVIVTFFIFHGPFMVYGLMIASNDYIAPESQSKTNTYFKHTCNILLALKSSCNFILYCWFSEKFWTTFKRIFCLHHCLPKAASTQPNGYNNNSNNHSHNILKPSCYITKETTC
ncbi:sex peptide receptor [Aplysia californica]|uniref:Sex peptide receptor n=1 Tax=Aplysia californica TaxID=6500 RepID=A0ABM0JPU0_APLCA|nr:sex peptide receptor [Aplysia californica]XP_005098696.1 sex peptide receptor [Aplysia californica]XP_005098699.1 sex peptide receptor [Aplysia californica]